MAIRVPLFYYSELKIQRQVILGGKKKKKKGGISKKKKKKIALLRNTLFSVPNLE